MYSGAIYFRGKPRYGNNKIFKDKLEAKAEYTRSRSSSKELRKLENSGRCPRTSRRRTVAVSMYLTKTTLAAAWLYYW